MILIVKLREILILIAGFLIVNISIRFILTKKTLLKIRLTIFIAEFILIILYKLRQLRFFLSHCFDTIILLVMLAIIQSF